VLELGEEAERAAGQDPEGGGGSRVAGLGAPPAAVERHDGQPRRQLVRVVAQQPIAVVKGRVAVRPHRLHLRSIKKVVTTSGTWLVLVCGH